MTRGVEKQEIVAELASLESLLGDISASRVLERRGLEGRARRLRQRLAELQTPTGLSGDEMPELEKKLAAGAGGGEDMNFLDSAEYAAQFRCPGCGGPSVCAVGIRDRLICRCNACRDDKGEPRFWVAESPECEGRRAAGQAGAK